jgi:glycosyltransferase involved in cell wall biosynthesis
MTMQGGSAPGDSILASVIISSYNYGQYLRETIDSCLDQTHPHVEVIVVDDGSRDDSPAIIAGYGSRIRAILKENGGHASALNAGFRESRGDVVCFLDSDDALLPTAMEEAVRLFGKPGVSLVHWQMWTMDSESLVMKRRIPSDWVCEGDLREAWLQEGPSHFSPTSGNAWSRAFLERVLPIPEEAFRLGGADLYLTMLAPLYGSIRCTREPQGFYRIHMQKHTLTASFAERLGILGGMWDRSIEALGVHGRALALDVDVQGLKANSWWRRIEIAARDMSAVIPEGEAYVLVEDDTWGVKEILAGRRRLYFLDRGGKYWGLPGDGGRAVLELERLRGEGAGFLAIPWSFFWLLERFPAFRNHLTWAYPCILENERVKVFDLRRRPGGQDGETVDDGRVDAAMGNGVLVSVLITNYNYGRFLKGAIESALNQTYSQVEVIVVDDGSTDDSRQVIAAYGDRIRALFKDNGGMISAVNAGLPLARGRVICFLDADDGLIPSAMERVVPLFRDPELVQVDWALEVVEQGGAPRGHQAKGAGHAWARAFLDSVFPLPQPEVRYGLDGYLWTLAPLFGRVVEIPDPLGIYRWHGENWFAGRSFDEKLRIGLEEFDFYYGQLQEWSERLGRPFDREGCLRDSWYHKLQRSAGDIARLLPQGAAFILVDEGHWGTKGGVSGRVAIPFLEQGGEYWGLPPDDDTAIQAVERLRGQGARAIVFAWSSFWWFEYYEAFGRHLRATYPCILENDRLRVFDLCGERRGGPPVNPKKGRGRRRPPGGEA